MNTETILITGGAGFIGSHLAAEALSRGERVIVIDSLATGHRGNVPEGAQLVVRDVREPGLGELIADEGVTTVSHHAAQANVRISVADPVLDAEANILGSLAVIEACRQAGLRRLLFASSGGTVYGRQESFPCGEDHPTRPISPYGCAKLAVESYLLAWGRLGELDPIVLRYANVYGARQDPKGEAGIVAIFAEALLRGTPPRILGDGRQTRDYVHVDDVARAHRGALRRWKPGVYNVATGIETPLVDLYRLIQDRLEADLEPVHAEANPAELRRNSLDPARLAETFGVAPKTTLAAGLDRTLPYYREKLRG